MDTEFVNNNGQTVLCRKFNDGMFVIVYGPDDRFIGSAWVDNETPNESEIELKVDTVPVRVSARIRKEYLCAPANCSS